MKTINLEDDYSQPDNCDFIKQLENRKLYSKTNGKQGDQLFSIENTRISDANLHDSYFAELILYNCMFIQCDFTNANFNSISVRESKFIDCDFHGASFYDAEFFKCEINKANFTNANCTTLFINKCSLQDVNFFNAKFNAASFNYCDLRISNISQAIIDKLYLYGCIVDDEKIISNPKVEIGKGLGEPPSDLFNT